MPIFSIPIPKTKIAILIFVALRTWTMTQIQTAAADVVDLDENYAQRARAAYALFNGRYHAAFQNGCARPYSPMPWEGNYKRTSID